MFNFINLIKWTLLPIHQNPVLCINTRPWNLILNTLNYIVYKKVDTISDIFKFSLK